MATVDDVAEWMVSQLNKTHRLYQEVIVRDTRANFGGAFVYINDSGNYAIDKKVLVKFRKLTDDIAIWERGDKAWRKRESYDKPGRQQD